jgi:hypothetical protein
VVEAVAVAETPRTGLAAAVEAKAERAMATTEIRANIFMSFIQVEKFPSKS